MLSFRFPLLEFEALALSYSGESPTDGFVEGYAASFDVRSSKTLVECQLSATTSPSHSAVEKGIKRKDHANAPNTSNMRITFEDGNLQASFPEMNSRSHTTDTGADDTDSLDL